MNKIFNKALFKENLLRFWSISGVAFLLYYITGLDMVIKSIKDLSSSLMDNILVNEWFWVAIIALTPVFAAYSVFSYLNNSRSVTLMHSLPFSRKSLFVTNYVSGLALSMIPVIVVALILLVLQPQSEMTLEYSNETIKPVYEISEVLSWLWQSFAAVIFTYSISVLGMVVSGNGAIAALTNVCLNGLIPVVSLCLVALAGTKYFGFYSGSALLNILSWTSPFGRIINHAISCLDGECNFNLDAEYTVFFIAALLIASLAYVLYEKRQNEKTGDGYVFKGFERFIGFLCAFVPCSLASIAIYDYFGFTACIYSGGIGFIIGQMVTRKTFHILNKETLKNLVVFTLIIVVLISSFNFDLLGYENRLPDIEDVTVAAVESDALTSNSLYSSSSLKVTDKEEIAYVIALHKEIIANKAYLKKYEKDLNSVIDLDDDCYESGSYLSIIYTKKNGGELARQYFLPESFLEESVAFDKLYDLYHEGLLSTDYMENFFGMVNYVDITCYNGSLFDSSSYYYNFSIEDDNATKEGDAFIKALISDTGKDAKFEAETVCVAVVEICVKMDLDTYHSEFENILERIPGYSYQNYVESESENGSSYMNISFSYNICDGYDECMEFLKSLTKDYYIPVDTDAIYG